MDIALRCQVARTWTMLEWAKQNAQTVYCHPALIDQTTLPYRAADRIAHLEWERSVLESDLVKGPKL